jgi:enamine deaminase RidA (YjgF/YER057c/UK114 family)
MSQVDQRLQERGVVIPSAASPVGNYVGYTVSGKFVFVSGQLPLADGVVAIKGRLGDDLDIDAGYKAARLCGLNILAQLKEAVGGDLDRVSRVVRLGGFVCVTPDFFDAPKCINGASDLMVETFGDAGKHARFAVGVNTLPGMAAVEVDATFELR